MTFSGDGRFLAAGGGSIARDSQQSATGAVFVWNVRTEEEPKKLPHAGYVTTVSFARDSRTLAAGDRGGTVKLWNTETNRELQSVTCAGRIHCVAFSPTEDLLAVACRDPEQAVRIWNLKELIGRAATGE